ncbi:MAG: outer membrane beta-barrel family protein [Prevotella sp.]|nr:outer membrane beta-barrel family protein [Prevotella sp.]MCI2102810.1 outer membrane beta-barrel family protein [Prevotella sp.]
MSQNQFAYVLFDKKPENRMDMVKKFINLTYGGRVVFLFLFLFAVTKAPLFASTALRTAPQKDKPCYVIGQVKDFLTHVLIEGAKVTLMTKDSVVVDSCRTSRNKSSMNLTTVYWVISKTCDMPEMLLKVEADGYETAVYPLPAKKVQSRGSSGVRHAPDLLVKRKPKTVNLQGVEVKATKVKFYHKGDTLVFNADAFQLAQGSMLDGLIRQLPGVELKDDGRIFVKGKYVESLLLNGEDFFSKDHKIVLDNLPAYMVKNVKVYDKASLKGEMLHKRLGDETYVMDVHLKREYNAGWIANAEVGGGTHDRYLARLFALRFTNHSRVSVFGNLNNLNDERRPGESTTWTPDKMPSGEKTQRQAGIDYLIKQKDTKYRLQGNAIVAHNDESSLNRQNTINYLSAQNTWTRYQQQATNHTLSVSSDNTWRWMPSRMTTVEMVPTFSWQHRRKRSFLASATFNEEPSRYVPDAISLIDSISTPQAGSLLRQIAVNRLLNRILEKSDQLSFKNQLNMEQNLTEDMMTSIETSAWVGYESKTNRLFSQYSLDYPSVTGSTTDYRNRYEHAHPNWTSNYGFNTGLMYWLNDIMFIMPKYQVEIEHLHHDDALYRLDQLSDYGASGEQPLGTLPSLSEYENTIDLQNSSWRTQRRITNTFTLNGEISRFQGDDKDILVLLKLPFESSHYRMDYRQANYQDIFHRKVWSFSPFFYIKKMWDQQQKYVVLSYTLSHEVPDLARFISVRNDADPLNITLGNGDLKNTHTHYLNLEYNGDSSKNPDISFNVWTRLWIYENALAMGYTYNRTTGVRVYKPFSVNGNRIFQAGLDYATPLDKQKRLSIDNKTRFSTSRNVDLMSVITTSQEDMASMPGRSIVYNTWASEDLKLSYKFPGVQVGLTGYVLFNRASSDRDGFETQKAWDFHYGPTLKATLPGKVELSTDLSVYSRRGYDNSGANTNDVVWNARLSKAMPKLGLTFMMDGFDILHQLSNISVTMNAQGRTEVWRNVLPNYVLFHVIYRFSKKKK